MKSVTTGSLALIALMSGMLTSGCTGGRSTETITVCCAAVMRAPMEEIAARYQAEHDAVIEMRFGGSNTLLMELKISGSGDVFVAADASYTTRAQEQGLSHAAIALAIITPVVIVRDDSAVAINRIEDLVSEDVRVAIANPDTAAIGRNAKQVLESLELWKPIEKNVLRNGVVFPNVNAVASAVALGSVDAGIVWDATSALYSSGPSGRLRAIPDERWNPGRGTVEIAGIRGSRHPSIVDDFVRFATSDPGCRAILIRHGLQPTR